MCRLWWLIWVLSYKRVFAPKTRKVATRKPANGDFGGFSRGDLWPCQTKIRQTVAENATHGMSRTVVWRGERSPCKNTKKSPFGGFSRGAFSPRKRERLPRENPPMVILAGFCVATFRPARLRYDKQEAKRRRMKNVVLSFGGAKGRHAKTRNSHHLAGFRVAPFRPENTIIRHNFTHY